jgi:hypothetical protein
VTSSFSAIRPDPEPSNHSAGSAPCLVRSVEFKDLAKVAEILTESFHSQEGINFWLHPVFRLGIYEDLRTRLRSNSPHYICLVAIASDAPNTPTDYCPIIGTVEMGLKSPCPGATNFFSLFICIKFSRISTLSATRSGSPITSSLRTNCLFMGV